MGGTASKLDYSVINEIDTGSDYLIDYRIVHFKANTRDEVSVSLNQVT